MFVFSITFGVINFYSNLWKKKKTIELQIFMFQVKNLRDSKIYFSSHYLIYLD